MSSELLNTILYKKIPSFASIHINSITFQKCHYLFLMTLLEKSDNSFKIIKIIIINNVNIRKIYRR